MAATFDMARFQVINYDQAAGDESLTVSSIVTSTGTRFLSGNTFAFNVQRISPTVSSVVTTVGEVNNGVTGPYQKIIDISAIGPLVLGDTYRVIYYDTALGPTGPNVTDDIQVLVDSCFVRGTLIRTPTGDMPVEDLKVGDQLISVGTLKDRKELIPYSEELAKPIVRVIKYRTRGKLDKITRPVKIVSGAFGENLPIQDLFVSPWHAFIQNGFLKSAEKMLNGSTIDYDNSCESAEYYHFELEEHSVIIANGVETESFYDDAKDLVA
jgi:hypothetical protein